MSSYIKLSTNEFPRHIGDIQIDPAGAADYAHVEWVAMPAFDPKTQRCIAGPPQQIDGNWYWTWTVRDATPEEIQLANKPFIDRFVYPNIDTRLTSTPSGTEPTLMSSITTIL
jgi:hypothetical protein